VARFGPNRNHVGCEPASDDVNGAHASGLSFWLPFIFGCVAYLAILRHGSKVLVDGDVYLHLAIGQWIVDHRAFPHADPFSLTAAGAHWITSAWLSEILYLFAFKVAGWAGPVVLAGAALAVTYILLTLLLLRRLPPIPVSILVGCSLVLTSSHWHARPHVLVFPLMVLWTNALVEAAEGRRAPSLPHLALLCLWANLHGSFTLGLALVLPLATEAIWTADQSERKKMALDWGRFGLLAIIAACITPYGPESILVTFRLMNLGDVLASISEWQPQTFGKMNYFEICLLGGMAYALSSGLKIPFLRILFLLAIIHETFAHIRYVVVMALVAPFFIAGPLAQHLHYKAQSTAFSMPRSARGGLVVLMAVLAIVTGVASKVMDFKPPPAPSVALGKIREADASRILNDYAFGPYLIYAGFRPFIDSRAELYGAEFLARYQRAILLQDLPDLFRLLHEYRITSTLLTPTSPVVGLLDRLTGWKRAYEDDVAVVHVYRNPTEPKASSGQDAKVQVDRVD